MNSLGSIDTSDTIFTRHISSSDDLRGFMNHAVRMGISDVFLTSDKPAYGIKDKRLVPLSRYSFRMEQVADFMRIISGSDEIRTSLAAKRDYDSAFSVPDEIEKDKFGVPVEQRFRLNATAVHSRGGEGAQIVMRHIPAEPPNLEFVRWPEELRDEFAIKQGAFLIAGETSSGKTTTFAACQRHILEEVTAIQGNILTFESPVEYLLDSIESEHSIVVQSEVGKHVESFADGVRGAMRRNPALVVIGELRDHETISAAVETASTGHPVFSTVHAADASLIAQRLVQRYPTFAQQQAFSDCISVSKLLVSQTLLPKVGGGVVCLRDYVILNRSRQEELIKAGYEGHAALLRAWMKAEDGARSMSAAIEDAFLAGEITEQQRNITKKAYGG